jgi:hypothetical protein
MWKQFKYSGRERVAYIAPEGPAFQVLDAGEPKTGFRAFNMSKAEDVKPAPNRFDLIPSEIVEEYPDLKLAMHK